MDVERKVKVGEMVLRSLIFGFGALAAALVASDSQVRIFFSLRKKASFTDMRALVFLVIANGMAAGYSLLHGVRCAVSIWRGSALLNKAFAWSIFSFDQILAYLMLAAVAAAVQSSVIGKSGQPELQWMEICNLYDKFCTQVGEGIASSVVASLCTIALSFVSAFNLFRLYGDGKSRSSTS